MSLLKTLIAPFTRRAKAAVPGPEAARKQAA